MHFVVFQKQIKNDHLFAINRSFTIKLRAAWVDMLLHSDMPK